MNDFVVTSQQGARCVFHSRLFAASGWLDGYAIDLEAPDFRASAWIANPGHGFPPSILFAKLASRWAGWEGAEEWRSGEGELLISATCDRTGHVELCFVLPSPAQSANWSASAHVFVEAGSLEGLAADARLFFEADV